jgi:hypothetical protein
MTQQSRDARRREWLAGVRRMGRTSFVWRRGVIGFGLAFMALITVFDFMFRHEMFARVDSPVARFALIAAFNLPFGALTGWLWGRRMWRWWEKRNWMP